VLTAPPSAKTRVRDNGNGDVWHDPIPTANGSTPTAPSVTVEWVTAEMAERYLADLYEGQRSVRGSDVQRYAEDMASGEWTLSNDAITFDSDGQLINGQNRLQALIRVGQPQQFLVMRGVPTKTYDSLDTGRKRSFADRLKSVGETDVNNLAAVVSLLWRYTQHGNLVTRTNGASVAQLLRVLEQHPGLRESTAAVRPAYGKFKFSKAHLGVLHYLFGLVDADQRDGFFDELVEGGKPGAPVEVFRSALYKRLAVPTERRFADPVYGAMMIKTWNASMTGASVQLLSWRANTTWPRIFDPEGVLDKLIPADG
jgi:hypothetical protein